jgi:hypothetical protein
MANTLVCAWCGGFIPLRVDATPEQRTFCSPKCAGESPDVEAAIAERQSARKENTKELMGWYYRILGGFVLLVFLVLFRC